MLRLVSQVAAAVERAAGPAPRLGPRLATFGGPARLTPAGAAEVRPTIRIKAIHTALPQGQRLCARAVASAPQGAAWADDAETAAPPGSAPPPRPTQPSVSDACRRSSAMHPATVSSEQRAHFPYFRPLPLPLQSRVPGPTPRVSFARFQPSAQVREGHAAYADSAEGAVCVCGCGLRRRAAVSLTSLPPCAPSAPRRCPC